MKINIKNKIWALPLLVVLFLFSNCSQDPVVEKAETDLFNNGGTVVNITGVDGIFDTANPDDGITFDVAVLGESPSNVDLMVSYNGGAAGLLKSVSSFPSSESVSLAEAAAGAGADLASVVPGDTFTFSVELPNYDSGSGFSVDVFVIFDSMLDGTFDAVTTLTNQEAGYGWDDCGAEAQTWEGTIKWEREHTDPKADGVYVPFSVVAATQESFEDMSHGAYYPCYATDSQGSLPNGDLRINHTVATGVIGISGASQWDEVYSINSLSVDGAVLTFNWTNNYGEGADVQLTRTDGADWPDNLTN